MCNMLIKFINFIWCIYFRDAESQLYLRNRNGNVVLSYSGTDFDVGDFKNRKRYKYIEDGNNFLTKSYKKVFMKNKRNLKRITQRMSILYVDTNKYFIKRGEFCGNGSLEFNMCNDQYCKDLTETDDNNNDANNDMDSNEYDDYMMYNYNRNPNDRRKYEESNSTEYYPLRPPSYHPYNYNNKYPYDKRRYYDRYNEYGPHYGYNSRPYYGNNCYQNNNNNCHNGYDSNYCNNGNNNNYNYNNYKDACSQIFDSILSGMNNFQPSGFC